MKRHNFKTSCEICRNITHAWRRSGYTQVFSCAGTRFLFRQGRYAEALTEAEQVSVFQNAYGFDPRRL